MIIVIIFRRRRIQRAYSRGTSMLADLSQLADLSKHDRHEHSMGELDGDSRTLRSVLVHNTSSGSVDDHGGTPAWPLTCCHNLFLILIGMCVCVSGLFVSRRALRS